MADFFSSKNYTTIQFDFDEQVPKNKFQNGRCLVCLNLFSLRGLFRMLT